MFQISPKPFYTLGVPRPCLNKTFIFVGIYNQQFQGTIFFNGLLLPGYIVAGKKSDWLTTMAPNYQVTKKWITLSTSLMIKRHHQNSCEKKIPHINPILIRFAVFDTFQHLRAYPLDPTFWQLFFNHQVLLPQPLSKETPIFFITSVSHNGRKVGSSPQLSKTPKNTEIRAASKRPSIQGSIGI